MVASAASPTNVVEVLASAYAVAAEVAVVADNACNTNVPVLNQTVTAPVVELTFVPDAPVILPTPAPPALA